MDNDIEPLEWEVLNDEEIIQSKESCKESQVNES